jgi:diguanylate cyclase (GGDEF)-like protein
MAEELRDTNVQLSALASIDGLTGIANRRALDARFAQVWRWAIRVQAPVALLMIDLDHFKQFNDLYGHHAGDQCLQTVAGVLTGHARRPQDLVARFGGEEFAVLLSHTTSDGARKLAEEIRAAVIELAINHQMSPWGLVTISIGCAAGTPSRGGDLFDLLQLADRALYCAKETGRNVSVLSSFQLMGWSAFIEPQKVLGVCGRICPGSRPDLRATRLMRKSNTVAPPGVPYCHRLAL